MHSLIAKEDLIAELDLDNNARISIEEAAEDSSLVAIFFELDTDKDVYLSVGELENE